MKRSGQFFLRRIIPAGSSSHDFRLSCVSLIPVAGVGFLVFLALFPVSVTAFSDISVFNINYTHDQLKFRFCAENTEAFITAAAVLLGASSSLKLFSFLQNKSRSAFYFSLGMTRERLYLTRTVACLLIPGLAMILPVLMSLILNLKALGACKGIFLYAFATILVLLLQMAAGVLIGQAGCFLSGTPGEALLASVTAALVPSVAFSVLNELMRTFLWGNVYGVSTYSGTLLKESLPSGLSVCNPICFAFPLLRRYDFFSRTMELSHPEPVCFQPMIVWLCLLFLFSVVLCFLFRKYRAERSGIAGLFLSTRTAVTAVWPAAVFAIVLKILQGTNAFTAFSASVACVCLFFAVIAGVYSMKSEKPYWRLIAGIGLLSLFLAGAGLTKTGFLSAYYHIPEENRIQEVNISYIGDPSFIPDQCSITQNGHGIYSTGTVTLRSPEAISASIKLEKELILQGKASLASAEDPAQTVYPYDIQIVLVDKKGREHQRYYDRIRASLLVQFLELEEIEELKQKTAETVKGFLSDRLWNSEAFLNGEIFVSDPWMRQIRRLTLSSDMRTKLLEALAEDWTEQHSDERYHPDTDSSGFLFFTLNGDSDLDQMKAGTAATKVYYSNRFSRTLSILEEWNALPDTGGIPAEGEIRSVQIQQFDPYSGMNHLRKPVSLFFSEYRAGTDEEFVIGKDFGTRPRFEDGGQIQELSSASVSSAFMDDRGCLAVFEMNSGDYIYRYIPFDAEPDFIKEKMN